MYQQCKKCILDSNDDSNIFFDQEQVCNCCHYCEDEKKLFVREGSGAEALIAEKIKKSAAKEN